MPDTLPDLQLTPAHLPADPFFARVVRAVRRHEARFLRAEQLTGAPYVYDLSSTAWITGVPVRLLRRLCREGELQAFKQDGWWLLHRDEYYRLLDPFSGPQWRSTPVRQHMFVRSLQYLAAMLWQHEAESTLHVLLHDLRRAVMFREAGAVYEDAEGMVRARAEWRIRQGIVDADQIEEALGLLRTIIELGMELLAGIDWRHSRLVSMIAEQTGVDLAV